MADWRRLQEKLERVMALYLGATTEGERLAAEAAARRLKERIEAERKVDSLHLSLEMDPPVYTPPFVVEAIFCGEMPDLEEMIAQLRRFEEGSFSRRQLRNWAILACDAVVVPANPQAQGAFSGEVLLHLATHHTGLLPTDVPELLKIWEAEDWCRWFSFVAGCHHRVRRVKRQGIFS